jgi:hypothetical protein
VARKEKWAAWSGIVAALTLVVALVFNGIQVHDSTTAQRQAKVATELSLLAQIQSAMTRSVYSRVPYVRQFHELRTGHRGALGQNAYRVTAEEAANMNYFAWLFNNGYLNAKGADELLGPQMVCEYQRAFTRVLKNPASELPDLVRFIQERRSKLEKLAGNCA